MVSDDEDTEEATTINDEDFKRNFEDDFLDEDFLDEFEDDIVDESDVADENIFDDIPDDIIDESDLADKILKKLLLMNLIWRRRY